jgi:hypothetical protein
VAFFVYSPESGLPGSYTGHYTPVHRVQGDPSIALPTAEFGFSGSFDFHCTFAVDALYRKFCYIRGRRSSTSRSGWGSQQVLDHFG